MLQAAQHATITTMRTARIATLATTVNLRANSGENVHGLPRTDAAIVRDGAPAILTGSATRDSYSMAAASLRPSIHALIAATVCGSFPKNPWAASGSQGPERGGLLPLTVMSGYTFPSFAASS